MKNLRELAVKKIMKKKWLSVKEDTPIKTLIKKFEKYDAQYLPVIDDEGKFVGGVHEVDIIKMALDPTHMSEHELIGIFGTKVSWDLMPEKVSDIMIRSEVMLKPDDTVEYVAKLMVDNNLKVLPVMEDKKIIGMVDEATLIKKVIEKL